MISNDIKTNRRSGPNLPCLRGLGCQHRTEGGGFKTTLKDSSSTYCTYTINNYWVGGYVLLKCLLANAGWGEDRKTTVGEEHFTNAELTMRTLLKTTLLCITLCHLVKCEMGRGEGKSLYFHSILLFSEKLVRVNVLLGMKLKSSSMSIKHQRLFCGFKTTLKTTSNLNECFKSPAALLNHSLWGHP